MHHRISQIRRGKVIATQIAKEWTVGGRMTSSTEMWKRRQGKCVRTVSSLHPTTRKCEKTHLSFSVDGWSASNESRPPRKVAALRPAINQNVERHVFLGSPRGQCCSSRNRIQQITHSVSWVSTPPMALPTAAPTGAPAAKVANAIERVLLGGKACARMPSWSRATRQSSLEPGTVSVDAPMQEWQRRNQFLAGHAARRW